MIWKPMQYDLLAFPCEDSTPQCPDLHGQVIKVNEFIQNIRNAKDIS